MPFLAVFRMAKMIQRLLIYMFRTGKLPYPEIIDMRTEMAIKQSVVWWYWWTKLFLLMLCYSLGRVLQPLYNTCFIYIDSKIHVSVNKKYKRKMICSKKHPLLVMNSRACVYTDVYNIAGKELAMLRISQLHTLNNVANTFISNWN